MKKFPLFLISMAVLATELDALAVIGRPFTPMSYAGVARRTSRRTVRRTSARYAYGYGATITALPAGCVGTVYGSMTYQHCGNTYYQPSYDGPEVVYVEVPPPSEATS